jgi:hypothetical protein
MTELDDWQILLGLFPSGWRQLSRSSGSVRRLRGFPSVDALLRTLLLHAGCGWSLRETAVQAKLAGIAEVSDVTLLDRLRDAESWLRQMCQELWKDNGVQLEPTFASRTVRLLDATVVRERGKTGSQWRIHYSLRLPTLECDHFDLTSTRGAGAAERFGRFRFQAGTGAGRCGLLPSCRYSGGRRSEGGCLCGLSPHGLPTFDVRGKPFPLLKRLARLRKAGDLGGWTVWIKSGDVWIAGRVCAIRKSQEAIVRAQRRLTLKEQTGKTVSEIARKYAEHVLVFTTLPDSEASAEQVLEIYRLRWQVELTFKRLKSIAQIGHVPKHDDQSSRAWLYGKLFVALLSQRLARIGKTISPWGYLLPQPSHAQSVA